MQYWILLASLYLCCCRFSAFAQTESPQHTVADSLRRVIATAKHDTTRVHGMIEMSWYCWDTSLMDSALVYAQQAKKVAERCGFRKGVADAQSVIASVCWFRGKYAEALEQYIQSLRIREELGNKPAIASTLNNIANVYSRQGKNTEALEYYSKSLAVHEELGNKVQIANLLLNIGVVYYQQNNYVQALENYTKALRIYEQRNDKGDIAFSLNNIGNVYSRQGKLREALDAHFKALRLRESLSDKSSVAYSLNNIGNLYFQQGRYNEALEQYAQSLQIHEALGSKSSAAFSLTLLGRANSAQGKYSEALKNYTEALRLREELGNKASIASVLSDIGNTYRLQGKYSEALDYQTKALRTQEALGDALGMSAALREMGQVYRMVGKAHEALAALLRALRIADSLGARPQKRDVLESLALCYDSLGQHKRALEYYRQFVALKDSIVNAESLEKTAILRESYDAEKREQQIALLSKEKEVLTKDKALQESEILRQQAELERADAEQRAQAQLLLLFKNEQQVRALTLQQQEAALTEAHLREERDKETLRRSAAQTALQQAELAQQSAELDRRRLVQWVLVAGVVVAVGGALWLGALYRQKNAANKAIVQQQHLLEEQAIEIQAANAELHQQNEELFALNNEKSELMGIVSHDLKNPIGAIRGLSELIHGEWVQPHEVKDIAGRIIETSDRMTALIINLLDAHRSESGRLEMSLIPLDVRTIVESVIWQYQSAAEAKQITLRYDYTPNDVPNDVPNASATGELSLGEASADDFPQALADELALLQVCDNLISNAVKYSPHGKNVMVWVKAGVETVRVEVQDEGPGISEEDMKKMFGKFARLSAQPTGGEHSTGLGLSIVKKMVEAMQGRVWCESELGKGATFIVELPKA